MTTTIKNGAKGTQGVNGSQTKTTEVATNGKAINGTAVATERATPEAKDIEAQMKFFDGLAVLVKKKRVLEKHKEALTKLELPDEVNDKFSNANNGNITITISDCNGDEYEIINAKLVQETRDFLVGIVDKEITDCDAKIMSYGN